MKTYSTSIFLILVALLVTACGANATPTQELTLANVYTAAASTLSAQGSFVTVTTTASITTFDTPTPFSIPTTIPATATATSQSVV